MRKIILASALAVAPFATPALPQSPATVLCPAFYDAAQNIMTARQMGAPLPDLMQIVEDSEPMIRPVMRGILEAAYMEPRWNTQSSKDRSIQDFANLTAATCYSSMGG